MVQKKILIIGDTIIDHDVYLDATGLSLESPTLKTLFNREDFNFGGASNVARMANKLGAKVTFITSLTEIMAQKYSKQNKHELLNIVSNNDNVKTRNYVYKGDNEYNVLQINKFNDSFCPPDFFENIDFGQFDIVAISDYRCGLLSLDLTRKIRQHAKIVFAASQLSDKQSNYYQYLDADYIVCNEFESSYLEDLQNVYVTLGENGCSFNGQIYKVKKVRVKKTIGAGDVFYAALIVSGCPEFANKISSKYVEGKIK